MNFIQVDPSKHNILVVDDTPTNLRFLAKLLNREGYNVYKALNGQMALMACQTASFDLILLDIMMPDMDGYEVCQTLKADPKTCEIPVIFLSALDDALDKVKAFSIGAVDYITKPFQFEEVLARVQYQLALKAAEAEILNLNAELEQRVKERTRQLESTNEALKEEIVERKQLQIKLLNMALHDPLTNLPNRAFLMGRLDEAIARAKQQEEYQFAVLFLDCDRFKVINDSLGHFVGDELLSAIARRLEMLLSEADTLARLGGDEFAIFLEQVSDIGMATDMAENILQSLSNPFQLSRYEVFINASIGITLGDREDDKPEYLLRDADTAMYRAKALGKARYHVFDPGMHQEALQLLELENDLRRAVDRKEFIVCYQPIVSLQTGTISGFEALVRWRHPTRGIISPAQFIPIAEETGAIAEIDLWVLQQACDRLKQWQMRYRRRTPLTISVNLSGRLFSQTDLTEKIATILTQTQLNPKYLKLEVTESALVENPDRAMKLIEKLKSRKIELCIDDFGTGYSSLSYLHRFSFNTLKIDKSFVDRIEQTREQGLVMAIIQMAHTLGMSTIAEGIETASQFAQLQQLHCTFGQGYLFAKPLQSSAVLELLDSSPQWRSTPTGGKIT